MLLLTDIINIRGHYARKKFYVIQPVTRVDSDLSSYDMIEWLEGQKCMRLTVRCKERCHQCSKETIMKLVIQGRTIKPHGGSVKCEKSVTKMKYYNLFLKTRFCCLLIISKNNNFQFFKFLIRFYFLTNWLQLTQK